MSTITSSLIRKDDRGELIPLMQELASLQQLTPKKLVELGRDPEHVLHKYFQWHDDIAAEKYRENQARRLIQSIKVTVVTAESQVMKVRAVMSLPPSAVNGETKRRYALTSEVANSADVQQRLREEAMVELARIRRKYEDLGALPEFAAVFAAVDAIGANDDD